ncbi:site-specific integrase [Streptomyces sp. NBC_01233]|uniref:site-specific integrase n=1 Tax=Streptomyces sp. NBC_01233 TaxID=2903787 RepID=UPI002E0E70E1|nr:site-specific integrase [Streptomyces sp. NBC_01233]
MLGTARKYAIRLGEERGWTVYLHRQVHKALGRLLTGLPDGGRISHTALRQQLAGTNLPMRRTAEILAALDLLDEDRASAAREWIERRTAELPDGFAADVRGWLLWLLDGDARTRPRALGTLHSYFGSVRPIVEKWAEHRTQLREITRQDVTDAIADLRGSQYTAALASLRSLFRYAKRNRRIFINPLRGIRVGRRPPGPVMPMSDDGISRIQTIAQAPAACLAVALAAVHAARGEAIRALLLDDLDFHQDRITIDGNLQPMGDLTRAALRTWLAERQTRWPRTLNRHVLVSRQTANGTDPVSAYFLKRQLTLHGVSLDRVRVDRVLGEALATGADPLRLTAIFNLSETTAVKYATLARRLLTPANHEAEPKDRPPRSQR